MTLKVSNTVLTSETPVAFQEQASTPAAISNAVQVYAKTDGNLYQLSTSGTESPVAPSSSVSANTVYAGPTSGAASAPSFRSLVAADFPYLVVANALIDIMPANGSFSYLTARIYGQNASGTNIVINIMDNGSQIGGTETIPTSQANSGYGAAITGSFSQNDGVYMIFSTNSWSQGTGAPAAGIYITAWGTMGSTANVPILRYIIPAGQLNGSVSSSQAGISGSIVH